MKLPNSHASNLDTAKKIVEQAYKLVGLKIINRNLTVCFYNVTMEPSTLIALPFEKLNELASKTYNIEHMLRQFVEVGFVNYYNKATSFLLQTPTERYESLITQYPEVLQRVTQYL